MMICPAPLILILILIFILILILILNRRLLSTLEHMTLRLPLMA